MADARRADYARQLDYAYRVIEDGSCSTLSLDVFDTILWRRVPSPADLFDVLGAKLRKSGLSPAWLTDVSFRRMRVAAEEEARSSNSTRGREVSLYDIWRQLPREVFGDVALEELVQQELQLERSFTVVDLNVADVIRAAMKNDVSVILVSDTYFTSDQLSYLLDRPELDLPGGLSIFRSLQYGLGKASGLWKSVLNELGQSPEQVVHIGDSDQADNIVPRRLGIRTVHYRRIDNDFAAIRRRERLAAGLTSSESAVLDPEHGDFGLTTLRARTLQLADAKQTRSLDVAWRYGAGVLGPVLTGFAEWVAKRAHDVGTPVVWCPMREGELLSAMVNNAAEAHGWDVEARPVWLSRQVTAVALIDPYDRDSVRGFIQKRYRLTVGQLLEVISLRPGDVPALSARLGTLLDHPGVVDQVTDALSESPHLRRLLAASVTATREGLMRSLREIGALDGSELTLVDLGWGGTIQLQLARILDAVQSDVSVSGLYLATDQRSTRVHHMGLRSEGYLGQAGHPHAVVAALRRSPEVIEQCISALCGSLINFDRDGAAVLGKVAGSATQAGERRAVQDGILTFQRQWNTHADNGGGRWPTLTEDARHLLGNIVNAALRSPTPDEAAVFGSWIHDDNFGTDVVTRVLPDSLRAAIPYLTPNDLDDLNMRDAFWPALVAASDPQLAETASARATGLISPRAFEPAGEPFETRLRFRVGSRDWHDGSRQRVRINHNGLSFARLGFQARNTSYVSLAIPGRPAIVRVDWIEAVVYTNGNPVPKRIRWETPEDFAGLTYAESSWLGGTMVRFDAAHSAVWLPLAVRAGAPVSSAQISIAFAMLPQSRSGLAPRVSAEVGPARLVGRANEEYRARGLAGVAAGAARVARRRLPTRK